tara:strand:- start:1492 stop:4422 length:2931 start_codon:yes stop_codon:yes gene_type:complete
MFSFNIDHISRDICDYFCRNSTKCATKDDLKWVFERWLPLMDSAKPSEQIKTLTLNEINAINKFIKTVSTGKQRHYKLALVNIVTYLGDVLHWQLPEVKELPWEDQDLIWFSKINHCADEAFQVLDAYSQSKVALFNQRCQPSAEFVALAIAMEVAPFSIHYLTSIINDPNCVIIEDTETYLKVDHLGGLNKQKGEDDDVFFTRYHLPLFVYRLLCDYQKEPIKGLTTQKLHKRLNQLIEDEPFYLTAKPVWHWQHLFQAVWNYRDNVVPTLLKDISYPERHVAFVKIETTLKDTRQQLKSIYDYDWRAPLSGSSTSQSQENDWPHKRLLSNKHVDKQLDCRLSEFEQHNILPAMLYRYTQELIEHGGVNKSVLADNTIYNYTTLQSKLTSHPLSYANAIDEEALQLWAHRVYYSLENDRSRLYMLYFFRFMRHQAITDGIDLTEFDAPTSCSSVDAYRLSLEELHDITDALLTHQDGHPLQRLFCAVSGILAYFAMLRRGEILRLRIQDIHCLPNHPQCFRIYIRKTEEGTTKEHKARTVHTVIPEELAKLVRIVLANKAMCDVSEPLIGFTDESYHSRQLNYLLPLTKAIKAIAGHHVRFHHLRHSGVHLFMQQALHMAYGLAPQLTTTSAALQRLLTEEVVNARFDYWLEGHHFSQCNDNLLFDEVCKQIGHENYATTRWSYLHSIDWLYPFYRLGYGALQPREYSHAELKYILNLTPSSNDLSRQLALISPKYRDKTLAQKQNSAISLTENQLRRHLLGSKRSSLNAIPSNIAWGTSYDEVAFDFTKRWLGSLSATPNNFIFYLFLEMRKAKQLNWPLLSQIWHQSGRHLYTDISKAQMTTLSNLPAPTISTNEAGQALTLTLACNVKNSRHFAAVFRQPQWQWLRPSFTLTINRKTAKNIQLSRLKQYFAKALEEIKVKKQSEGDSHLTITLTPTFTPSKSKTKRKAFRVNNIEFVLKHIQMYIKHVQQTK